MKVFSEDSLFVFLEFDEQIIISYNDTNYLFMSILFTNIPWNLSFFVIFIELT